MELIPLIVSGLHGDTHGEMGRVIHDLSHKDTLKSGSLMGTPENLFSIWCYSQKATESFENLINWIHDTKVDVTPLTRFYDCFP